MQQTLAFFVFHCYHKFTYQEYFFTEGGDFVEDLNGCGDPQSGRMRSGSRCFYGNAYGKRRYSLC